MATVDVRSIDALLDMKQAIARYTQEAPQPLDALERETLRTLEWLAERRRVGQRRVEAARQTMQATQADLARCEATAYRDSRGNVSRPDCSGLSAALGQAVHQLRQAESELHQVEEALKAVERAHEAFHRQRQGFLAYLAREGAASQNALEHRAASLRAYTATGMGGLSPGSYSVTAPTDALASLFALGAVAGALGLTSLALAAIQRVGSHLPHSLGSTGEDLSSQLLRQGIAWEEMPFDQPKHGFDRLFRAPGLPIIIMESKVNSQGRLHLGQTQHGEQGSAEWIANKAEKMADPTSAQYSANNAALAALIQELGPENLPRVAVVITTVTGAVDIHYRAGESAAWEKLPMGGDLTALLAAGPAPTEAGSPSTWVDQGIQMQALVDLPLPEGIGGAEDFHKVSAQEMRQGLLCLQEMLPTIQAGPGASSDYWRESDRSQGLDYAQGRQRIYDTFYGSDAIRVVLDGAQADIINGQYRLWLAREMGIHHLPMLVIRRKTHQGNPRPV